MISEDIRGRQLRQVYGVGVVGRTPTIAAGLPTQLVPIHLSCIGLTWPPSVTPLWAPHAGDRFEYVSTTGPMPGPQGSMHGIYVCLPSLKQTDSRTSHSRLSALY